MLIQKLNHPTVVIEGLHRTGEVARVFSNYFLKKAHNLLLLTIVMTKLGTPRDGTQGLLGAQIPPAGSALGRVSAGSLDKQSAS